MKPRESPPPNLLDVIINANAFTQCIFTENPRNSIHRMQSIGPFLYQQTLIGRRDINLNTGMHPKTLAQMLRNGYLSMLGDAHVNLGMNH